MPLASAKASRRPSSSNKNRFSLPSTISSSTKVTRSKVEKRRASLRGRDPSPAPSNSRAAGKENEGTTSSPTKSTSADAAAKTAPGSPGPTPYWIVAAERASQGKNPHSPRTTRSASKKSRPRLPPFAARTETVTNSTTGTRGGGMVLSFSPPDQKANRRREDERLTHRHFARDGRIQNARDRGQYLEFSPRSGMPRQSFDDDDDGDDPPTRRRMAAERAEADLLKAQREIFRSADDGKHDQVLQSIQADMHKLLQAQSSDETEKGRHIATLEVDNKNLVANNEILQQSIDSLELEKKELQEQMGGMKERLLVDTFKLETELTSAKREAEVNLVDKEAATSKMEQLKEQLLVEKTRMESEIESLQREAAIRLEGLGESRKGLEEDKTKLAARVEQLEQELFQSKDQCTDLKTQQSKLDSDRNHLESAKGRLQEQLEETRAEKCTLEEQVADLKNSVALLGQQSEGQVGALAKELESQKEITRQMETKLEETEDRMQQMETELDTLENEKEEERVNFQQLNEESTKAFTKLEKATTRKDSEMENMSNEIEAIAADLEGEQRACQNLEGLLQEKEKETTETIQKLESLVESAAANLEGEQRLCQDLETKLQQAETKTGESVHELQARADSIAKDLEREEQLRQTAENQLQQRGVEMGKEVCKFQNEAESLAGALEDEQRLRTKVEKQLKQRQADLKEVTEELQTQIETLEDKLALADTDRGMLQEKLDVMKTSIESISSDKTEALNKNSEAAQLLRSNEKAIEEMKQTIESVRGELHGKQIQLTDTQVQLKQTEEERKDANARMESFDVREDELFRKLRESDRIRRDLHNKVMQLSGNIRVYVRVRPELPGEMDKEVKMLDAQQPANSRKRKAAAIEETPFKFPGIFDRDGDETGEDLCKNLMEVTEPHKDRGGLKERRKKWKFGFDNVFTPTHGQEEIWEATDPLVQSAIDGYNVCLFAYGQTGSGKTYTMLGDQSNKGIITRAVTKLFDAKAETESLSKGKTNVSIKVELLEIYNERIRDLLSPESTANQNLKVTSNNVEGTMLVSATSSDEVMEILEIAQSRRCVKATNSNSESSRSHMVFTIHFDVTTEGGVSRKGKLHVCDLAGSERLGKSGANASAGGSLLKETKAINSSLSVLSNVIEKLQNGNANVPFRESKLTMLLSGSLGGNSKTLAIVCCNPLASHFHESLCSLRFAEKVNKVELKASSNFSC